MKELCIIRHGKAEGDNSAGDYARDLTTRGVNDCHERGKSLRPWMPDMVVASAAKRTRHSAEIIAAELGFDLSAVDLHKELYGASPAHWLGYLTQVPADIHRVLIVGHNPGLSEFVHYLVGLDDEHLRTSEGVLLRLPVDAWNELSAGIATVERWLR